MSVDPDSVSILHVDDDPGIANLTAEMLESEDDRFTVETVLSASDGLERLENADFDCVVADYQMPGMDGISLLEAVRDDYPRLPFILFTGAGSEEVASRAISAGATDYLQKGTGTEQFELLVNRVQNAVEQYLATRRAASLQRVRTLVADINQSLVHASDRDDIETSVCELITDSDPYLFAWIGTYDPTTETVVQRASDGVERGYLDTIEVTTDESVTGQGPTGEAIRSREIAIVQRIEEHDAYEPWREEAIDRGYRASAAVPLVYDDALYGVLNVYADRPEAFDDRERQLLEELRADIAHAVHAREIQRNREQEMARLEALFEQSPDMIDVHDSDGTIVDANPMLGAKLGYPTEELVGDKIWDVDQRFSPNEIRSALAEMEIGDRMQTESRYQRKDGTSFPVEVHLRRLDLADGQRFLVITHDISDRKERERKLKEQTERFENVLEVVAHDLRTPLTTAQGYVDLVRDEIETQRLDEIDRSLERMERIIGDLLWLAQEGKEIGTTEPVALSEVLSGAWQIVIGTRTDADLVFEVGDADSSHVEADYDRLRQLLENLFDNAIKHVGPDVTVRVEPLATGFAIADDGSGIPDEERDRVFEQGHTTADDGTGLGLYIAREIAEAHGWDIRVTDSDAGGARFEITGVTFLGR